LSINCYEKIVLIQPLPQYHSVIFFLKIIQVIDNQSIAWQNIAKISHFYHLPTGRQARDFYNMSLGATTFAGSSSRRSRKLSGRTAVLILPH
jgi:hypothetical protein